MKKKQTIILASVAGLLFTLLFVFQRLGPLDFWWWMTINIILLNTLAARLDPTFIPRIKNDLRSDRGRKILLAFLSALLLYLVIFIGSIVIRRLFPIAGEQIGRVYSFKEGASNLRILLLMVCFIGPGEELFWRFFLQHHWQIHAGRIPGLAAGVLIYTAVHLGSGNPVLILAALICGLFWGLVYNRSGSILTIALSHTLWDVSIFVFWAMGS